MPKGWTYLTQIGPAIRPGSDSATKRELLLTLKLPKPSADDPPECWELYELMQWAIEKDFPKKDPLGLPLPKRLTPFS